jgi:type VI secretion system protein ImpF
MPIPDDLRTQRVPGDQPLKRSVLDRLIVRDDDPRDQKPGAVLRDIRECVRRDLEDLLNTRPRCDSWPDHLTELDQSLANYGLPDCTGSDMSAPMNHGKFSRILQRVIETFEPRLTNVTIQTMSKTEPLNRTLSFRIEATLRVDPIEEPIVLDSTIEPISASFAVTRADR